MIFVIFMVCGVMDEGGDVVFMLFVILLLFSLFLLFSFFLLSLFSLLLMFVILRKKNVIVWIFSLGVGLLFGLVMVEFVVY